MDVEGHMKEQKSHVDALKGKQQKLHKLESVHSCFSSQEKLEL